MSLNKILTGVAGEYLVAAELSRRGYVASLTLRNTRGINSLASNTNATKSVGIQVKTNSGKKPHWLLSNKVESDSAENLFYVFVNLNGLALPAFYIVPRAELSQIVKEKHKIWRETPGAKGQPHNETTMRAFQDPDPKYKDAWPLLGLDQL